MARFAGERILCKANACMMGQDTGLSENYFMIVLTDRHFYLASDDLNGMCTIRMAIPMDRLCRFEVFDPGREAGQKQKRPSALKGALGFVTALLAGAEADHPRGEGSAFAVMTLVYLDAGGNEQSMMFLQCDRDPSMFEAKFTQQKSRAARSPRH